MRNVHPLRKYVNPTSVALATLGLLVTACGSSSSTSSSSSTTSAASKNPTGEALLTYQGSNATSVLEAAAKSEGKLNFMTSLAGPVVTQLTSAFEKAYPYIHLTVNRADENTLIPQTISEEQAGKPAADVFEVTSPGALELRAAGLLLPYADPTANMPAQYLTKSGSNYLLATDRISWLSFGYNTNKIPAADVPKTLSDLTNPALKGQLVTEASSTGYDWIGSVLYAMGQTKGEAFLAQLGQQNKPAIVAVSGAATAGLVASGQYGASFSVFQDHFLQNAAKGSPVKWLPLEPVIANVGQFGVLKGVQDPAAAALFVRFETGPIAQKVFEDLHYGSPNASVPFKSWVPTQGATTATQYASELKSWEALQKKDFG
ncbi:MAG: extracellular solute-binding protein [Acidimicrobiaceae bacterium]|nr:extracellular solute-binding protein [Acidimicrobiaceae bacterium]